MVAVGGAPGEALLKNKGRHNNQYPEGVDAPAQRYSTGYGLNSRILNPPWTTITAYDMNEGTIKWTRPHGEHPAAVEKGIHNSGVPNGTSGQGMIVTSNGIVFATVNNGQIYAYNADDGEVLWSSKIKHGISSISSMYEVDGKIYLVVNGTKPVRGEKLNNAVSEGEKGEYVVFSLPK